MENKNVGDNKKSEKILLIIAILVIVLGIVGVIGYACISKGNYINKHIVEELTNTAQISKSYNYYDKYEINSDSFIVFNELGLNWKEINTYDEFWEYLPKREEIKKINENIDEGFFDLGKVVFIEYSGKVESCLDAELDKIYSGYNIRGELHVIDSESKDKNILKSKLYILTMTKEYIFTDVEIIYETEEKGWLLDDMTDDKPIIYLYPNKTTELSVKLEKPEKLICSYPEYKNEWRVIAEPDGTLIDVKTKRKLYALYWEGKDLAKPEMTEGFVVKGEDTIKFLEEKLEILGLNERETEEFIIYWLPKMQNNEYNYIRFATSKEINEYMPLQFSVEPDSLIRVLMQYKGIDEYIEVSEQKLETPTRAGFVVVEWGGSEIK